MIILGVDTGGTFTDFIYRINDEWKVYKILSTPDNPARAVLEGYNLICKGKSANITHGSTVATNALLERKGAKTALITNKGFEDLIEIGRQNRNKLYDLKYKKIPPLIPSNLRFGVRGRINYKGEVVEDIDCNEVKDIVQKIKALGVESVAVCLLFSFKNDIHERVISKELENTRLFYSLSSEVLPEFREYERMSTTVINGYVSPKMTRYLSFIEQNIGDSKLRIMQSNGGSISAKTAMKESVRTILSGPAGGVVGAFEIGKLAGFDRLITFDMGGTSTDVSLIDKDLPITTESEIAGFPIKTPMIHIHTVGAGGGSIAYFDKGGALKVGPQSAGADPGPICYGKGEHITVTDANLYLGRLIPERFLGGYMKLHVNRLNGYFEDMAKKGALNPIELAEGILRVANANMEKAIRVISVEKGYNPSEFVLFSFGGAGGMHACFLARLLNIPKVLVPKHPGILSAIGMLIADVIKDYSKTIMIPQHQLEIEDLNGYFKEIENKAISDLLDEAIKRQDIVINKFLDIRYKGQSYEILVPFKGNFIKSFHKLHERIYGYCNFEHEIEIVNIRIRARGKLPKPQFKKKNFVTKQIPANAILGETKTIFSGKECSTSVYDRELLLPGNEIKGPAIIVEYSSTIVIPEDARAVVDEFENILITT